MKRMKTRMRRIWSIVLTIAMIVSMCGMPAVTAKAEKTVGASCNHVCDENCGGMQAVSGSAVTACTHVHDEECGYEEAEAECTCGTDDPAIHATTCAVYVAPENPVCSCAEACGVETQNFWCDVCGFDYAKCTGTDTAVVYTEGDKVSVTINGETTYYTSIKDAVAKANESGNATITLLQDTTTGERLDITNSATLDLNGNTLSCTAYFADDYETMVAVTTNGAKLTIIDSIGGGKLDGTGTTTVLLLGKPGAYIDWSASALITGGTVSGEVRMMSGTSMTVSGGTVEGNTSYATVQISGEATLNVSGGQILNTHSGSNSRAIDNGGTVNITGGTVSGYSGVTNSGTANISGNTNITGTERSVVSNTDDEGALTITGGNYTGGINITGGTATISGGSYTGGIVVSGGTATISDGTITESSAENAVEVSGSAELTISGGTFSATAGETYDTGVYVHNGGTVKITGGTITSTAYGVYNEGGSATITGGSISGGTVDLQVVGSDSILNLTLDEGKTVGATFPGGITAEGITLAELLATDTAYWGVVDGKDTMLTVADDAATGITDKGDITIRAICDHKDVKLDYITTETTHTPVCSVCNWTIGEATEHTGGTATCQDPAICEACGVSYGDLDANIHTPTEDTIFTVNDNGTHSYTCACGAAVAEVPHTLDVTTGKCSACGADASIATVTDGTNTCYAADAATLNQAVTAILETGSRTFTVELPADAEAGMITAIRRAICDTEGVADGSIHLTLKGVTTIPGTTNWDGVAFGPGDIYDEAGKIVDQELVTQLASINLPDVTEIGAQAFYFCENLVSVSAPKAQTIGAQAFGYTALTSVEFPELTTIPTDMFSGIWTLSSAKFPKVTTIEQGGLLVGAKFTPENNPTPFPLELTAEGNITFNGSNHFNIASQNYSGKVDLVLCCNKKDAVTFQEDGTATWQVREDLSYTFKSITFKHSYVNGKCTACGEDCTHTGGTATCTTLAVCEACGVSYGEVGGHSPNAAGYTVNADGTHSYTCSSCGNPFTESHTFTDGACTGCGVIGGYCGEEGNEQNVIWTYANGTLTISGTGAIADQRDNYDNRPWEEYVDQITTIVVNDGITSIGEAAFWRFQKLTTAKLPDSLTTISQQAFYGCTALKTVNFPANLKTIEGWAFLGCALESVTLPEGLTTIGYRAFSECKNLTSVTVPASVTTIDEGAFGYSPAKITVAEDNHNYSSDEHGVLFDKDKTTLIYCRPNIEVETYTIPSTVTEICKEAFYGCKNLATITIPDGVQKIGSSAFGGCEALTTITIPAGVTTIEANTFYDCTALTAVTIPAGVTTIDMWAFSGCTALTTVTIPASVTSIAYNAFSNCSALTTVNVPCTWDGSLYTFDEGVTVNKVHNWVGGACTVCGVSCDHTDSTHTAVTDKGDGTHSFNCSVCGSIDTEDHDFSYNANNNVITASCNKCETTGTATITAENVTYTGSAYANASVSYSDNWQGNRDLTIVYKQGETILDAAPVNAGDYTAYIEYKGAGVSVYFTIAKEDSTITAAPTSIADLVYDGSAQNLINAGTALGGEMQYSLDGTSYSPAIPTGTDAKTYIVWYKVDGDENHNDTEPASVEVTVTPKSVTVTADNKSKTYGEADSEFTYTATGLVGSDTLTGTLSRETGDNVGTYAITQGTLNNPNYDIAFVEGTFTINKATPVSPEIPEAAAITYGDTLSSSVLSDSSWTWLDGTIVPDRFTDCIAYIEVDDINYDYTGVNGYDSANHRVVRDIVVTINKATLTITAKSYTIKVGATLPTYDYTVTGLVGDDTLPVDVTISCSASDNNAVGTYPITISGEVSDNIVASLYVINYVDGTLTIAEKDTQEITADDMILTYGETENIGATTNGDGTITYATTSDVISVAEDGMITVLKAGTATVTIRAAETADYAAAAKVICVTVNKAENAPNLPSATMNVSYDTKTVGAVTLPTGWTWEAADVTKPLTTGEAVTAIALYKGADAGNYENETIEVVITRSACSHSGDTELKNASAATCTVAGYTGDLYCKDCGERISVGQSISAPGHDYNSEVTTEATTTSEGVRTYTCENCGDSYTESIPKLPMPTNTPTPVPTATPSPVPTATPTPTPTSEPTPTLEPTPEPEELPHIQGEDGKAGWDAIIDEIEVSMKKIVEDSEEKVVVTVEMNGSTKVPKDIFEQIAEKDISVEFMLADGLMWTVNGKTVETEELKDFNLAVALETEDKPLENIPIEVINTVSGERDSIEINLAYSGEFGFEAILTIGLEKKNAGLYANLFFYNEETGELEFICADVIAADGKAELSFTHASDYLVVLSEESMEPVQEDAPVTELNYTIVKGDTLSKIAAKYGCTVKEIVELNKELIQNPDMIQIGWKLRIPVKGAKPAPEQETPAVPAEDKKYVVYVVKKGDTLWVISQQCGCTVKDIMELNRELIKSPDLIHTGWELMVPEK